MKKLTIFRTCEYETLSGKILLKNAYQTYAQAQSLLQELGPVSLIVSSHIPEAVNTAKIIQLAAELARISENPRLSRYHAGKENAFKKDFLGYVKHYYSHMEHIILVSHNMNITALTGWHIRRGSAIVLESENWETIFDLQLSRISVTEDRLIASGSSPDILADTLSQNEKARISALSYVAE